MRSGRSISRRGEQPTGRLTRRPAGRRAGRQTRRLSLLVRFALISAALLTSVGLVLANWFAEIQRDRALGEAARTAELVARAATGDVLHVEQLRRDFVPMDEADRVQFDDKVRSIISDDGIVRFKIWNAQHWIVYSDNPRLIGRWFPGDDQLAQALAGESSSMVTDLSDPEEMEERDFGRLLAVYVPLRLDATTGELTGDGDGEVVGAFEIYVPYSTIDAALADLMEIAADRGYAIGVASALPGTIAALEDWISVLEQRKIAIVPLTALLKSGPM